MGRDRRAPDWLQDYDAALIRKSNANFVRWMHVAPKPAPVRSFDKFGIVCAAPAGDKEGDVSGRAWAQRVEAMRRCRAHSQHCASVELLVNGKSKGVVSNPKDVFVYEFKDVDVTESGKAEVIARNKEGKEIARHSVSTFEGPGRIVAKAKTGPKGWLADGSDIAMVDFTLVDANGTVHPFASGRIQFTLSFVPDVPDVSYVPVVSSPAFMGGWNSGVFGEASPIGKDKNLTNCAIYRAREKSPAVCGELVSLVGYIPGVEMKTDTKKKMVEITVRKF